MTQTANSQDTPLSVPKTRCQLRVVQTPPPLGVGGGRKGRGCRPQVRWRGRVRRGHGLKSRCGGRPWRRLAGGGRAAGAWCVRSAGCPDCPPVMVPTGCQDGRAASDWPPMMGPRPLGPEATPCLPPLACLAATSRQPTHEPRREDKGLWPALPASRGPDGRDPNCARRPSPSAGAGPAAPRQLGDPARGGRCPADDAQERGLGHAPSLPIPLSQDRPWNRDAGPAFARPVSTPEHT